ncbi:hypothetical protein MJT46_012503 [Ovis ammon polii x Ovis aries]|nr:hypothetical protein MJT46_012503 [Ovis ammon polii x Ovis aries]
MLWRVLGTWSTFNNGDDDHGDSDQDDSQEWLLLGVAAKQEVWEESPSSLACSSFSSWIFFTVDLRSRWQKQVTNKALRGATAGVKADLSIVGQEEPLLFYKQGTQFELVRKQCLRNDRNETGESSPDWEGKEKHTLTVAHTYGGYCSQQIGSLSSLLPWVETVFIQLAFQTPKLNGTLHHVGLA